MKIILKCLMLKFLPRVLSINIKKNNNVNKGHVCHMLAKKVHVSIYIHVVLSITWYKVANDSLNGY